MATNPNAAQNQAPVIDLNGEGSGTSTSHTYVERDFELLLAPQATVFDPDSPDFLGGSLTVAVSGGGSGDVVRVSSGSAFRDEDGILYYGSAAIGSISGGYDGAPLVIRFDRDDAFDPATQEPFSRRVTPAIAEELIRAIAFYNVSTSPSGDTRTFSFTLDDGDGGTSAPTTSEVAFTLVDDPAVAEDDFFTLPENSPYEGSLFTDNQGGTDGDPDGTPIFVTAVNGDPNAVGREIVLESGARLTVFADGRFVYDARGAFDLASSDSGAVNGTARDGFSYTITGGDTADVAIDVTGDPNAGDTYRGDEFDNQIFGTPDRDVFRLEQGGNDQAFGYDGNDSFYFGGAFDANDLANGGGGFDVLILQGNYADLTFNPSTASNIPGIESISLFSGLNTSYGDTEGNRYDYRLTLRDANTPAGGQLRINGFGLAVDEDMTVDGSAETNGTFLMFGGRGVDTLVGGAGGDAFVFGHDGRFGAGDSVTGGGGYDVVYLRGDYLIDFTAVGAPTLAGVESIALLSGADTSFVSGGDGASSYVLILSDALAADGGRLTVNGSRLGADETIVVDGSAEEGASLRIFAGAGDDTLTGGGGDDLLYGNEGADLLAGNGGADVFRYQSGSDSTVDDPDRIDAFESGIDKVDLGRIDTDQNAAGDQAFRFIGEDGFSGEGGAELRLSYNRDLARWEAEGDLDGNGSADFLILFTGTEILTGSDFLL